MCHWPSRRQQKTNLKKISAYYFLKVQLHHFSKINRINQRFSIYFCLMIEGSGSGSILLTNESGSGSGRPKICGSGGSVSRFGSGSVTLILTMKGHHAAKEEKTRWWQITSLFLSLELELGRNYFFEFSFVCLKSGSWFRPKLPREICQIWRNISVVEKSEREAIIDFQVRA
jgi:hypothetical protein